MFLNENDYPKYVIQSLISFHKIVTSHKDDSFESLTKANKGESFVLRYLAVKDNKVFPSEIGKALGSSNARISALLNTLEKKDFIIREIDETNRRNILVSITDKGRFLIKEEITEIQKIMANIFLDMGEKDSKEFIRLFNLFSDLTKKHIDFKFDL